MVKQTDEKQVEGRAEQTRQALIEAAIKLFGNKGYDHTSVRDLVKEAGTNLAAINYHFGGKEGLRQATIEFLAQDFKNHGPGQAMAAIDPANIHSLSKDEARQILRQVMKSAFMQANQRKFGDKHARYVLRELVQGGELTEYFFDKVFSKQFALLRVLVAHLTDDDPESETTRVRSILIVAQSAFLNLAQPLVLLALDWEDFSGDKADIIGEHFWVNHE
ncbi:MAG: CerR family C-terminal domain-containing protein [Pseudomonadota bacterium]